MPVPTETASVNPSTRQSRSSVVTPLSCSGIKFLSTLKLQLASTSPSAPPASDSIKFSVSNWRMMRPRPAPRAVRTAISRLRPVARASSRFAMLAQAISSTHPTAPSKIISASFISPT